MPEIVSHPRPRQEDATPVVGLPPARLGSVHHTRREAISLVGFCVPGHGACEARREGIEGGIARKEQRPMRNAHIAHEHPALNGQPLRHLQLVPDVGEDAVRIRAQVLHAARHTKITLQGCHQGVRAPEPRQAEATVCGEGAHLSSRPVERIEQ